MGVSSTCGDAFRHANHRFDVAVWGRDGSKAPAGAASSVACWGPTWKVLNGYRRNSRSEDSASASKVEGEHPASIQGRSIWGWKVPPRETASNPQASPDRFDRTYSRVYTSLQSKLISPIRAWNGLEEVLGNYEENKKRTQRRKRPSVDDRLPVVGFSCFPRLRSQRTSPTSSGSTDRSRLEGAFPSDITNIDAS